MSKYVVGIDPDAKAHGVAIYVNGELSELSQMTTMQLMVWLQNTIESMELAEWIEFSIEDVASQNFMYSKHRTKKSAVNESITRRVGMCQQAQIELERMIAHHIGEDCITRRKPSKQWKDKNGKAQFEKVTGWNGRSNEDTRSAAYFGYLSL